MNIEKLLVGLLLVAAIAGCTKVEEQGADASQPSQGEQKAVNDVKEVTSPLISSSVARLDGCAPAAVTLSWDVSKSHPDVATVKVMVGTDADAKLFSESGPVGSASTDAWVMPGTTFALKGKGGNDETELARIVIGGPACN